jgi:protein phosphatase/serine/threonine-protein phosphatase Stp1
MTHLIRSWSATHCGTVRTQNQDAFLCRPEIGLFAVADGVGGQHGGEIAAAKVVEALNDIPGDLAPGALLAAVRAGLLEVHQALLRANALSGAATTPATTVVVLMLHENHFACLWAGDSRAYLLREGQLCPLTTDHSVVQELLDAGAITAAEAELDPRQNIITRAIGAGIEDLRIAKSVGMVMPDDRFMLCSDGLYKSVAVDRISAVMAGDGRSAEIAHDLIQEALAQGARDNVTAVVAVP